MIQKSILCMVLALNMSSSYSFDFIDINFDAFKMRIVVSEYREKFTHYHTKSLKNIDLLGKSSAAKKNAELARLRQRALYSLENKHPDWALQLKPYKVHEKDEKVQIFLRDYAVYEEFVATIARERAGMWYRFKSYSKHVSSKVATFFTGFKGKGHKA